MNLNKRELLYNLDKIVRLITGDGIDRENVVIHDIRWVEGFLTERAIVKEGNKYQVLVNRYPMLCMEIAGKSNYYFHQTLPTTATINDMEKSLASATEAYLDYWMERTKTISAYTVKRSLDGR